MLHPHLLKASIAGAEVCQSATGTMSAKPATHAPAQAAARSHLPRNRINPVASTGIVSTSHGTAPSSPAAMTTPGSPTQEGIRL
jgi:hypothetical protein